MSDNLTVSYAPHIRKERYISTTMRDVLIALMPALIGSVYFFGFRTLIVTAISVAACIIAEYTWDKLCKKPNTTKDLSCVVTGVLLAIQREVGLNEYVNTGISISGKLSTQLLGNIFINNTPLHDGAVIVRDGRIVGAGCMLPLSSNVNLSRDLGMRHRAGIGISEHSDAVVVIVSEETGSISAAVGGMLKRHLAPETLERLLRKELIAEVHGEENKVKSLPVLNYVLNWIKKGGEAE